MGAAQVRRRFSPKVYAEIVARQGGLCACGCKESLGTDPRDIQFDHEIALHLDGADTPDNLRALKKRHHLEVTKRQATARAKSKRIQERDGMMRRRLSRHDQAFAKLLEKDG